MPALALNAKDTVTEPEQPAGTAPALASPAHGAPAIVRNFDLVILLVGLPIVLLASLPILGYGVGAAAWIAQRLLFDFGQRRTRSSLATGDRRSALGWTAGATLGRVWMVTIAILLVGLLGARADGLTAAVLTAILVTVFLGGQAFDRLLAGQPTGVESREAAR